MRWLVGVDPRNYSAGAVMFARRLARSGDTHEIVGLHVVEWVPDLIAPDPDEEVRIRMRAQELLAPLRPETAFTELGAVLARTAVDGLVGTARERDCDAMIVGRVARRESEELVRLGRVARKLVRTLPLPVVVVPPDLEDADICEGPVLIAVMPDDSSVHALRWGLRVAAETGRDIVLAHVVEPVMDLRGVLPSEAWDERVQRTTRTRRETVADWVREHAGDGLPLVFSRGSASFELLEVARAHGVSMLVVGSRRLTLLDRLFSSSLGAELAANVEFPVAVVPPEAELPEDTLLPA